MRRKPCDAGGGRLRRRRRKPRARSSAPEAVRRKPCAVEAVRRGSRALEDVRRKPEAVSCMRKVRAMPLNVFELDKENRSMQLSGILMY